LNYNLHEKKINKGILTVGALASPSAIIVPPGVETLSVDYGCDSNCINVTIEHYDFILTQITK
jgi:hypothetical protein